MNGSPERDAIHSAETEDRPASPASHDNDARDGDPRPAGGSSQVSPRPRKVFVNPPMRAGEDHADAAAEDGRKP
ncbi:hypothetical protein JVX91_27940 [Pseudomonas sp. PDNC002]|uniref:hypothetical protein n=1 Tax=Pseudomonas sp. PDNC002 TaxID=2811422 RepID=UPI001963F932|nr:hypothetical protein [Pseudomonas sp. PDNC002]QRY79350.1 hypothetical protein JVX91_27940 [Pseudomonas sp. PDNC002]